MDALGAISAQTEASASSRLHFFNLLPGGHSSLEPRLPIPNRTVKRVCADDSVHLARESRLPPDHLQQGKARSRKRSGFFVHAELCGARRTRATVTLSRAFFS